MSGNLSFTQELREMGLIQTDIENNTNENIETKPTEEIKKENNESRPTENIKNENNSNYDEKIIFIGKKSSMNYVLAINSRMNEGLDEITVKARGKTISKAVDVAEIVTNRFVPEANDDQVKISTEEILRDDGTSTNVSTIEIVIKK